jgi:hypothetical protein
MHDTGELHETSLASRCGKSTVSRASRGVRLGLVGPGRKLELVPRLGYPVALALIVAHLFAAAALAVTPGKNGLLLVGLRTAPGSQRRGRLRCTRARPTALPDPRTRSGRSARMVATYVLSAPGVAESSRLAVARG